MKVITFSLYTQEPLLATSFQGDRNSDISYSYIPGSMIRGGIIGRYLKQHGLQELDLDNNEVKRLFFDANSTKYLNAYLLSNDGKRTIPVMRSWFKEKDAELNKDDESSVIKVFDFGIDRSDELENPKFIGEGFCIKRSDSITIYKEKRRINIHNQRDRKQGRSTQIKRNPHTNQLQGEGQIFRYEAIDSGQTFQGAMIFSNDTDANLLIDLLEKSKDIWLGGSRTAGYGHLKINNIKLIDDWNEIYISPHNRTETDFFTVTLLSDLILRDEWGQYAMIPPSTSNKTPAPLTQEIEKILGIQLQPRISYASSTLIGGFNRKWGLPLPQVTAFAAGSVFVFEAVDVNPDAIKDIEARGIGERRNEGFGRIAINWLDKSNYKAYLPSDRYREKPELKQDFSRALAAQMAESLLHQKIERVLQNFVGKIKIEGDISNSQLSRLQIIAGKALSNGDCNLVLSLLHTLPSNAKNKFERAKVYPSDNRHTLIQQLQEWLEKPESWIWISNKQDLTVNVANIDRSLTDEFAKQNKLAEKYTLRLIMALAKKAMKENK